jgi:hypothetical protein
MGGGLLPRFRGLAVASNDQQREAIIRLLAEQADFHRSHPTEARSR